MRKKERKTFPEMVNEMSRVPAIVVFFTFWFGRPKTDWAGIQREFHLSDEIIARLRKENEAYRSMGRVVRGDMLEHDGPW